MCFCGITPCFEPKNKQKTAQNVPLEFKRIISQNEIKINII